MNNAQKIKNIVKKSYGEIAQSEAPQCGCGCNRKNALAKSIGYSDTDINAVPDANLGLGCGNPTALGKIKPGDVVLDLGSGAGFDAFLAAKKVGADGKVIGVDMTEAMIQKAKANAEKYHYSNVEFRLGDIEHLPVEDATVDIIISNCVINLAPDKLKVFQEAHRVLKIGGRIYLSDIVLLSELTPEQRSDEELIAGCVGGAVLKDDYIKLIRQAGFMVNILGENKDISKKQYMGLPLESISIEAIK